MKIEQGVKEFYSTDVRHDGCSSLVKVMVNGGDTVRAFMPSVTLIVTPYDSEDDGADPDVFPNPNGDGDIALNREEARAAVVLLAKAFNFTLGEISNG